ncbi:MAG: hypothetical protein IJZ39_12345 [Oscillospiraceae bacterium]|nr:hypothetical protein [Oscillospiraceae bacterium]
MKDSELRKYLRQNKPTKKTGQPGSFYLRMLYCPNPVLKSIRKDIGLGTNDEAHALLHARLLLRACCVLGAKFTAKIKIVPKPKEKKLPKLPTLWDWYYSQLLPPRGEVEKDKQPE